MEFGFRMYLNTQEPFVSTNRLVSYYYVGLMRNIYSTCYDEYTSLRILVYRAKIKIWTTLFVYALPHICSYSFPCTHLVKPFLHCWFLGAWKHNKKRQLAMLFRAPKQAVMSAEGELMDPRNSIVGIAGVIVARVWELTTYSLCKCDVCYKFMHSLKVERGPRSIEPV